MSLRGWVCPMCESAPILTKTVLWIALLLTFTGTALAQDALYVTGVSQPGAAWVDEDDGSRFGLGTRGADVGEVTEGIIGVASDNQLMLLTDSGQVVIVLGPAKVEYRPTQDQSRLIIHDGKLIATASWPNSDTNPLLVMTPANQDGKRIAEAVIGPGYSFFQHVGNRLSIAFLADDNLPGSMALKINGSAGSIPSGDMITISGAALQTESAALWLTNEQFNQSWGINLGVASAQTARPALEATLFANITEWDIYGGAKYVTSRLEAGRYRPEIRQVVSTVSTPQRTATNTKGAPETTGFPAANEVPVLSPAALSVVNPTENVTAIQLNIQARGLLTITGSRGLGFRGLSQLAISGLYNGGNPTVGPAGLGAQ